jgi:hypothetical protein
MPSRREVPGSLTRAWRWFHYGNRDLWEGLRDTFRTRQSFIDLAQELRDAADLHHAQVAGARRERDAALEEVKRHVRFLKFLTQEVKGEYDYVSAYSQWMVREARDTGQLKRLGKKPSQPS